MSKQDQKIWEIIENVLRGNPTTVEKQLFDSWINESEKNRKIFNTLKNIGLKNKVNSLEIKNKAFSKIQSTILSEGITRKLWFWRYSTAASIAMIIVVGVISLLVRPFSRDNISYVETESPLGIKTKVILSDSSVVYLNSGSYLKYPSRFSGKQREVILEGEAYFEVRKDVKHTFTVHAGSIDIVVFGTHFNLKAYNDENFIKTTLAEGSVGVYKKQESNGTNCIKLVPNQQAIYDKKSGDISIEKVDAELSYAWKDGKYYFESETFAAIARKLERNFNVNIKINSEQLKKEIFSGLFDKNRSVFQLLDAMKRHENFYYTVKNDTIMITKN